MCVCVCVWARARVCVSVRGEEGSGIFRNGEGLGVNFEMEGGLTP